MASQVLPVTGRRSLGVAAAAARVDAASHRADDSSGGSTPMSGSPLPISGSRKTASRSSPVVAIDWSHSPMCSLVARRPAMPRDSTACAPSAK